LQIDVEKNMNLHSPAMFACPSEISNALRPLLADVCVVYLKPKNLDWYLSGCKNPDKSDNYSRLLAEHTDEISEITNTIADFARVIGGAAIHTPTSSHPKASATMRTHGSSRMKRCVPFVLTTGD
jgi:DNA-binding ferritin-like protein